MVINPPTKSPQQGSLCQFTPAPSTSMAAGGLWRLRQVTVLYMRELEVDSAVLPSSLPSPSTKPSAAAPAGLVQLELLFFSFLKSVAEVRTSGSCCVRGHTDKKPFFSIDGTVHRKSRGDLGLAVQITSLLCLCCR